MPSYPSDANDTLVYNGVDLYIPKDCSATVFEDSRVFLFGEWYLNGQPIMSGSAAISGQEVQVGPTQPTDAGMTLWFDTSAGYGELKAKVGGTWKTVEDPADATLADEVAIGIGQPAGAGSELWIDTNTDPAKIKAKIGGNWTMVTSDEVVISGTEPTDPNIELWVDTATSAPAIQQTIVSSGNALGIIKVGSFIAGGAYSQPAGINVRLSNDLIFTSSVGRRYRVVCQLHALGAVPVGGCGIILNGAPFTAGTDANVPSPIVAYSTLNFFGMFEGTGATHTIWVGTSLGNPISIWLDTNSAFFVEDCGPSVSPIIPVTDPVNPTYAHAGNALGIVAVGSVPTGASYNASTVYTLTNPLVFRGLVGRRYRIRFQIRGAIMSVVGTNEINVLSYVDGVQSHDVHTAMSNTGYSAIRNEFLFDGDGLSHTYDMRGSGGNAWSTATGQATTFFYIEDVGPNQIPALPLPATDPPWTPVTVFTNSWVNYSAGYPPTRYRKIGDVVYLEGCVKSGTANSVVFTLPVGFRPAYITRFPAVGPVATEVAVGFIDTAGVYTAYQATTTIHNFNIQFSVTP